MQTKENHTLEICSGAVKLTLEGPSEAFRGNDLKLRAIHALIDFDFKYDEIRDKYYVALLTSLGEFMKSYDMPGFDDRTTLVFLRDYLRWCINEDYMNDPELKDFLKKHLC